MVLPQWQVARGKQTEHECDGRRLGCKKVTSESSCPKMILFSHLDPLVSCSCRIRSMLSQIVVPVHMLLSVEYHRGTNEMKMIDQLLPITLILTFICMKSFE
jgi:hypothetical protein